jgi:hypothetical protein
MTPGDRAADSIQSKAFLCTFAHIPHRSLVEIPAPYTAQVLMEYRIWPD